MKRPLQHYPLVEVWWDDASAQPHGWAATVTVTPQMVLSVGFLVFRNGHYIVIAQDTDAEGQHNGRTQIPKHSVKKLKVLKKTDVRIH